MVKWLIPAGIILILFIMESIRETSSFKVTDYDIPSHLTGTEKGIKIAFLSDLHNHSYGKQNEKLFLSILAARPDIILIGGDMLVRGRKTSGLRDVEAFIGRLTGICPVYYANGNHEQRIKENTDEYKDIYRNYRMALTGKGVVFLENERADIILNGVRICVTGLELPMKYYGKLKKHNLPVRDVESCIGEPDPVAYNILLAHNPLYADTYIKWGADLILSGHLHGGIIRLPGIGGIISPQFSFFPGYSGELSRVGDQTVVVSRGLGTHTVNIRLFNPAELVILNIRPESPESH